MNDCRKSIGWADYTWNPVTGCLHTCPYCYARVMARRFGKTAEGKAFKPEMHADRLWEPVKHLKPAHIFVGSACDLWGAWVPETWIDSVMNVAHEAVQHAFLFLTKNPAGYEARVFPANSWQGFTAENQDAYRTRSEYMRGRRNVFVSLEPLQGPVRIAKGDPVDWVIVGQETGSRKGRVIVDPKWIADIAQDCREKGVPLYVKGNITAHDDRKGYWPQAKPVSRGEEA